MSGDWATWRAASAHKSSGAWTPPYSLFWAFEDPEDHSHTVAEGAFPPRRGDGGQQTVSPPGAGTTANPGRGQPSLQRAACSEVPGCPLRPFGPPPPPGAETPGTLGPMPDTLTTLIDEELIAERIGELAAEIDRDYEGAGDIVLIGVLKGSFVFLADLGRRLKTPHRVEFISVSSYGDRESEDPGAVRLILDVRHDIGGKHVLVVEDIVDTGHTLAYLVRLLNARLPASLKTCTLLRKPDRTEVEVPIDYLGFDIPDVWVVGYGLDFAERYRTLPRICAMKAPE